MRWNRLRTTSAAFSITSRHKPSLISKMTADSCHSPRDERPTRPVAATAEEHRPAPASPGIRRTEDRAQHSGHRKGPVPRSRFSITICCKTRMHQPGLPWRAGSRPSQCSRPQHARPWHGSHGEPYSFAYVRVTAAGARRRCGTAPRSRVHLLREGRLADRRQAATRPAPVNRCWRQPAGFHLHEAFRSGVTHRDQGTYPGNTRPVQLILALPRRHSVPAPPARPVLHRARQPASAPSRHRRSSSRARG